MSRAVLLLHTRHEQRRSFGDAAERLGVRLVASDRHASATIEAATPPAIHLARSHAVDACLAADGRGAVVAAAVARALGVPGHPPGATDIARNKLLTRERLRDTDLPVPWFFPTSIDADPAALASMIEFPCVVKPLVPSGGAGVMRADDAASFVAAFDRVRGFLGSPAASGEDDDERRTALVEGFIDGWEFALEGVMHHGALNAFALFDKPDPLDGPIFEDTLYVTPSLAPEPMQWDILDAASRAAAAIGLRHGPIHAELRVGDRGVYVLGVAARPLDAGWAKALRFQKDGQGAKISYEELLLRHALGDAPGNWRRETAACGAKRGGARQFAYACAPTAEEVERELRDAVVESDHG